MPPDLALHTADRLVFAFHGVQLALANREALDQGLVGSFGVGEGDDGVGDELTQGAAAWGLDPPHGGNRLVRQAIRALYLSHALWIVSIKGEGDIVHDHVVPLRPYIHRCAQSSEEDVSCVGMIELFNRCLGVEFEQKATMRKLHRVDD